MTRYRIILNPEADRGKVARRVSEIKNELDLRDIEHDIVKTEYSWHASSLAIQAVEDGVDVVVAAGGDGTINEVINGLMTARDEHQHRPALGVLSIGRGNDFAYSVGIPTTLSSSAQTLADNHRRVIDIGYVGCSDVTDGRYFGNGVGVGFDAKVGFTANKNRVLAREHSYLWAALKETFLDYDPPTVRMVVDDDEEIFETVILASVMNGTRIGANFMLTPDADPSDGQFNMCFAKMLTRPEILSLLPRVMAGTHYSDPTVKIRQLKKVVITALKGSLPAHVDGETLCTEGMEITIGIIPQAIEVITQP